MQEKPQLGDVFDPKADLTISEHFRPHWDQSGAVVFITFRTADSIPREVLQLWEREKQEWVNRHNGANKKHWSKVLPSLSPTLQHQFKTQFNRLREASLDSCLGQCVLRQPEAAKIVADSLLHFDGQRYRMGDIIIMPNHVHLMVAMKSEDALVAQCDSWLHFSAHQINLLLGRKGKFWQQEPFDHLIRSSEQYEYLRKYIRENGRKAGLKEGEYLFREYQPKSPFAPRN